MKNMFVDISWGAFENFFQSIGNEELVYRCDKLTNRYMILVKNLLIRQVLIR